MKKFFLYLNVLFFPVLVVVGVTFLVAFHVPAYVKLFEKHRVYDVVGSREVAESQAENVLFFLEGREELRRDFFNEKERRHMLDVRKLFSRAKLLFLLCAASIVIFIFRYPKEKRALIWYGSVATLILLSVLLALMWGDFSSVFLRFHQVAFSNEDWILDPATDRLILLFPESLFQDLAVRIVVWSFVLALVCALCFSRRFIKIKQGVKCGGEDGEESSRV